MHDPKKQCFYCGSFSHSWIVVVGNRAYPCCRDCKVNEATKDFFVTRPK